MEGEFTGGAYITTDRADNQITGFNPGAMGYPCMDRLCPLESEDSLAIVAPGNVEDMVGLPKIYRRQGLRHIFDPGQQLPVLSREQIRDCVDGARMLISNDYELQMVERAAGLTLDQIEERVRAVVTTLGEEGSLNPHPGAGNQSASGPTTERQGPHRGRRRLSRRANQGPGPGTGAGGGGPNGCGRGQLCRGAPGDPGAQLRSEPVLVQIPT